MIGNYVSSFFARMARKSFGKRLNQEILDRLFPHLERESNEGYPFTSDTEMNAQTEALDVVAMFEDVERQVEKLPTAYGECFRYLMHKDIVERLQLYADAAQREIPPVRIEPRFVAKHV